MCLQHFSAHCRSQFIRDSIIFKLHPKPAMCFTLSSLVVSLSLSKFILIVSCFLVHWSTFLLVPSALLISCLSFLSRSCLLLLSLMDWFSSFFSLLFTCPVEQCSFFAPAFLHRLFCLQFPFSYPLASTT